ncbi:MAG: phosphatase PAP2 family protein [Thermoanaerobaculia bacterium]|nr:phosphatase PAP2 family protein [Thermoanaerobaculia bacterium]
MSTSIHEPTQAAGRGSAIASALLVALLAVSVTWPDPVLRLNRSFFNAPLDVSEVSFLGREAPRWDVVYWWIVGMTLLVFLRGRLGKLRESWPLFVTDLRTTYLRLAVRGHRPRALVVAVLLLAGSAAVAASYFLFDMRAIAAATGLRSDALHDWIRLTNRFGGGANPPMVVLFFVVAGLALGRRDWWRLGSAMAIAGVVAGAIASLMKRVFERARPDTWLGHDVLRWEGETSFPSGHTIGAFALMVVILAGARSRALRIVAVILAVSVAVARVLALRHWPSDVLMSATLGSLVGLLAGNAAFGSRDEPSEGR